MDTNNTFSFQKLFRDIVKLRFLAANQALSEYEIHPGQIGFLMNLYEKDGLSQKDFAKKLNIKPSTIAVMVQRLEKTNMIKKITDNKDQRISRIFLTDNGINTCKKIEVVVNDLESASLLNFTEEEKCSLEYLLSKIKLNLEETYK